MTYRVGWQLVGLSGRPLDSGFLEDVFDAYGAAVAAIDLFVRPYPEVGRNAGEGYWWARRSADADIEMRVWIENEENATESGTMAPRLGVHSGADCEEALESRRVSE